MARTKKAPAEVKIEDFGDFCYFVNEFISDIVPAKYPGMPETIVLYSVNHGAERQSVVLADQRSGDIHGETEIIHLPKTRSYVEQKLVELLFNYAEDRILERYPGYFELPKYFTRQIEKADRDIADYGGSIATAVAKSIKNSSEFTAKVQKSAADLRKVDFHSFTYYSTSWASLQAAMGAMETLHSSVESYIQDKYSRLGKACMDYLKGEWDGKL